MIDLIEFGKIVNTHGLKGEFKVYSYTDNTQNILKLKKIYLENKEYQVENIRTFKNMFILKLKGVDDIEQAKCYINKMCYRKVIDGESNAEDGYFIRDLIGLDVLDESGNKLGVLKEVFTTGANDVYEIETGGKSIYIPAIKQVVKNIDITSKTMIIKLMEGLV